MTSSGKKQDKLTGIPGQVIVEKPPKKTREENRAIMDEVQSSEKAELAKQQAIDGELINPVGRPTIMTDELVAEIMSLLAMGKSVRTVCRDDRMPAMATFYRWLQSNKDFREQYARAKADAADAMLEDLFDISDDAQNDYQEVTYGDQNILRLVPENIQRSKLRVETRKWAMSKLQPKKYGDKLDVTSGGKELPTPLLAGLIEQKNINDDINDEDEA